MTVRVFTKDHPLFKECLSEVLHVKRRRLEKWTRELVTKEISRTRDACVEIRLEKDKGASLIDSDGNVIRNYEKPET